MTDDGEKKFLHDLVSALGATLFLADSLKERAEEKSGAGSDEAKQAKKLREVLQKMKQMIEERRALVRSSGESGPKAA